MCRRILLGKCEQTKFITNLLESDSNVPCQLCPYCTRDIAVLRPVCTQAEGDERICVNMSQESQEQAYRGSGTQDIIRSLRNVLDQLRTRS